MEKFIPKDLCIQIIVIFWGFIHRFRTKATYELKLIYMLMYILYIKYIYVLTPRPKMYMPGKIEPIPSTLYSEQF